VVEVESGGGALASLKRIIFKRFLRIEGVLEITSYLRKSYDYINLTALERYYASQLIGNAFELLLWVITCIPFYLFTAGSLDGIY